MATFEDCGHDRPRRFIGCIRKYLCQPCMEAEIARLRKALGKLAKWPFDPTNDTTGYDMIRFAKEVFNGAKGSNDGNK